MSRPWLGSPGRRVGSWGRRTGGAGRGWGASPHGRPRGSRGTWDRVFRRKYPGGLGAALGSGSFPRGPRFPPPEGVVESVAQVLGSWDDRRLRGGTGHGQDAVAAARAAVPAAVALGAGGFRPRTGLHSVPPAASHGWGPTSARPGASPGVCTERGARQPPPRLSAHCGRAQESPLRTAWKEARDGPPESHLEDLWGEESQCPRGSRSTCVGVGADSSAGGGGAPLPGGAHADAGGSERRQLPSGCDPTTASRRGFREAPAAKCHRHSCDLGAGRPRDPPGAPTPQGSSKHTCGGRGPGPRSAQASPAHGRSN